MADPTTDALYGLLAGIPGSGSAWRGWLSGQPPEIIRPPYAPPGFLPGDPGDIGQGITPPVRSLHDAPAIAARPLSPNLEDLRFQRTRVPLLDWLHSMFPPGQSPGRPLVGSTTGDIQWSHIDPNTWYLYNTQPGQTPTTTLPPTPTPPSTYGAAEAAIPPPGPPKDDYGQQMSGYGQQMVLAPLTPHEHYQALRDFRNIYRGLGGEHANPEDLFPLIQHLWNQGTIYGWGGGGMGTAVPYDARGGPLLNLFERYQDYLNAGNPPVAPMGPMGVLQ